MDCPKHGEVYLFKELLPDGGARVHCVHQNCVWNEVIEDRHKHEGIPTRKEMLQMWGEA